MWFLVGLGLGLNRSEAAVFTLPVLDQSQIDPVLSTLASTTVFRSMEPCSHPDVFGFWINARVNATFSKSLASIVSSNMSYVPFGNIQAGINAPLGLGIEFGILPSQNISGTSFGSWGGAIKWSYLRAIFKRAPFDSAIRGSYTSSFVNFSQTISGIPLTVNYNSSIIGATLDISKQLLFFEPYVGYGFLLQNSSLGATGTVSLFNSTFPVNTNTVTSKTMTGWFHAGFELKLFIVTLGAQYDNAFGSDNYAVKFGFKF